MLASNIWVKEILTLRQTTLRDALPGVCPNRRGEGVGEISRSKELLPRENLS